MRKIEALAAITFTSGRFRLTPEQMQRRRYVVKVLDAEQLIVEPKGPSGQISFKRGEVFESDVPIGKGNASLRLVDEEAGADAPNAPPAPPAGSESAAGGTNTADAPPLSTAGDSVGDDPLGDVDLGATGRKPRKHK